MTNDTCKTRPQASSFKAWTTTLLHPPWLRVQIDSPLTSPNAASESSELGTEAQSHHQLPIPHCIANAGQGFRGGKACRTSTKDVVG